MICEVQFVEDYNSMMILIIYNIYNLSITSLSMLELC